jgi:hypothetical protein
MRRQFHGFALVLDTIRETVKNALRYRLGGIMVIVLAIRPKVSHRRAEAMDF